MAGSPGVLALGAVIYYERGNKEESEKWISRFVEASGGLEFVRERKGWQAVGTIYII